MEAIKAAEQLKAVGVDAEVIDLRSLRPWDEDTVLQSVRKTGRLVLADTGTTSFGVSAEVVARVAEEAIDCLLAAPRRVALPDCPSPTIPALAAAFYPRAVHVQATVMEQIGLKVDPELLAIPADVHLDVPDPSFTGPF